MSRSAAGLALLAINLLAVLGQDTIHTSDPPLPADPRVGSSDLLPSLAGAPLMMAFDGTLFFFPGQAGRFYNLISEEGRYQVTTRMKKAETAALPGNNGNSTVIQVIGFSEEGVEIKIKVPKDDNGRLVVMVNNRKMKVMDKEDKGTQTRSLPTATGALVNLTLTRVDASSLLVDIISHSLRVTVMMLEHPTYQYSGVRYQAPSNIRLKVTLLEHPQAPLQGVLGEMFNANSTNVTAYAGYAAFAAPPAVLAADLTYPRLPAADYEVTSLYATASAAAPGPSTSLSVSGAADPTSGFTVGPDSGGAAEGVFGSAGAMVIDDPTLIGPAWGGDPSDHGDAQVAGWATDIVSDNPILDPSAPADRTSNDDPMFGSPRAAEVTAIDNPVSDAPAWGDDSSGDLLDGAYAGGPGAVDPAGTLEAAAVSGPISADGVSYVYASGATSIRDTSGSDKDISALGGGTSGGDRGEFESASFAGYVSGRDESYGPINVSGASTDTGSYVYAGGPVGDEASGDGDGHSYAASRPEAGDVSEGAAGSYTGAGNDGDGYAASGPTSDSASGLAMGRANGYGGAGAGTGDGAGAYGGPGVDVDVGADGPAEPASFESQGAIPYDPSRSTGRADAVGVGPGNVATVANPSLRKPSVAAILASLGQDGT